MVEDLTSISAAVLLSYEYLITLSAEVQLFWKLPITGSSVIFVLNRYLPLLVICCIATVWSKSIFEYFQYFPWAAFSALRVYALGDQNWWITSIVFLLSTLPAICHYIRTHWLHVYLNPAYGCSYVYAIPDGPSMEYVSMNYAGPVLSDLIVLAITWRATYRSRRSVDNLGRSLTLSQVIFRDGESLSETAETADCNGSQQGLFTSLSAEEFGLTHERYCSATAILVSRFLIDLQRCSTDRTYGSTATTVGTLNFDRVLGSISSSLPAPGEASYASEFDSRVDEHLQQCETDSRMEMAEMDDAPQEVRVENTT
ncbi:hypothetical protein K466DRAFT_494817 [Polyporus arcularius HHB13444]|uniref:DUF6533 domain-containing protein n=1 Tax=Polyporus arcularius HHB13444 TaxID=1314778 RepID=A0A5C3PB02_9APHY|nr:hypothetical protein K466DRAFT_494817 [Polyporus arcularius HHB13444]